MSCNCLKVDNFHKLLISWVLCLSRGPFWEHSYLECVTFVKRILNKFGFMQNFFILRYLCSSCCKKFPSTGDKNSLIPTFLTNLAFEQKWGDPERKYLKHLFGKYLPYSSKMWAESDSLMAFCWLWYQVSEGKTGHHINVLIANGKTFIRFSFIAPIF